MARMAFCVLAGVIAGSALSSSVLADPVFSTGTVEPGTGPGREMTAWVQADDFAVAAGSLITGASVQWFTPNRMRSWDREIQWFVFEDSAGTPGAVVGTGGALNVMNTFDGAFEYDWYTTSFDLDAPVAVNANQKYWFGLHFSSDYDQDDVYWADIDSDLLGATQQSLAGLFNNWASVSGSDRAFQLVPAPGAVGGVGLGLVALARRRRSVL